MKAMLLSIAIALASLSIPHKNTLNPYVYNKALAAYKIEKAHNPTLKPILTIVDFSLPDSEKRLWVIDLNTNVILYNGKVAHGEGSGKGSKVTSVSNVDGSKQSSIGSFVTLDTYIGHNGLSLKLKGLDKTNSNVYKRMIVIHGSAYVTPDYMGHSWGCFAVAKSDAPELIKLLKNNTFIYAYWNQ